MSHSEKKMKNMIRKWKQTKHQILIYSGKLTLMSMEGLMEVQTKLLQEGNGTELFYLYSQILN
jgi:hypothetical protein